jgi:ABC-type nickel/cobalt efflux system permease component RcnA
MSRLIANVVMVLVMFLAIQLNLWLFGQAATFWFITGILIAIIFGAVKAWRS